MSISRQKILKVSNITDIVFVRCTVAAVVLPVGLKPNWSLNYLGGIACKIRFFTTNHSSILDITGVTGIRLRSLCPLIGVHLSNKVIFLSYILHYHLLTRYFTEFNFIYKIKNKYSFCCVFKQPRVLPGSNKIIFNSRIKHKQQ